MTNDNDPLMNLVDLISAELKSGAEKSDIVDKLVSLGMDKPKAEHVVDTVSSTRDSHFSQVFRYFLKSIFIFSILFTILIYSLDSDSLTRIAKYDILVVFSLLIIFAILSKISGKIVAYFRYGVSYLLWMASAILAGLLFIQNSWADSFIPIRGGIAAIFIGIINIAISIGPFWIGVIVSLVSFAFLVITWAESYKIREGMFSIEE